MARLIEFELWQKPHHLMRHSILTVRGRFLLISPKHSNPGDPSAMVGAIHAAARACGIADVADKAGLSCEDLEKISAATEFGTIVTILQYDETQPGCVSCVIRG